MEPDLTGRKYDKIATWWDGQHHDSSYGITQVEKALRFVRTGVSRNALDVGCGAGGRIPHLLEKAGFSVTGVDVSAEMIRLARAHHPTHEFFVSDFCTWQTEQIFDLIVAWDSIFHVPLDRQRLVLTKMCRLLNEGGVLIHTFGDAIGAHTDTWHDDEFYYSSIGVNENLDTVASSNCICRHLELDQFPEKHVFMISQRERPQNDDSTPGPLI